MAKKIETDSKTNSSSEDCDIRNPGTGIEMGIDMGIGIEMELELWLEIGCMLQREFLINWNENTQKQQKIKQMNKVDSLQTQKYPVIVFYFIIKRVLLIRLFTGRFSTKTYIQKCL